MRVSVTDFKRKLEEEHSFPTVYMFKFIVPSGKEEEVIGLLPPGEVNSRFSREGNYVSITAQLMMPGSEDIIDIYNRAHKIKGLIAL